MLEPISEEQGMMEPLKEKWEEATPVQKLGVAAVICLILAVFVTYSLTSSDGNWKPLFSQLSATRASQIVEKLDEMGQPYRLGGDGSLILVPPTAVNRLRLELASAGLLEEDDQGFELFESASLSRSDFSERVTYLRALQGELASTIASIENVKKARVHLNLNRRPIFLDQKQQTSAAVYVEMALGSKLNENQIRGIISLVANSVEGLDPSRVTLFDSTGTLQVSGEELEDGSLSGGDSKNQSEELSRLAQSMVDRILGPGKGLASVRVELDHKVRRVEKESHAPGGDGQGVPLHREDVSEVFEGTKPGGPADANGGPGVQVADTANGEKPKYQQQSSKVDFAVSRTTEVLEEKPGGVSRISASVIVDSNAGLTEEQLQDLALGVKTAIGLDDTRGDKFELRALPFNREHLELASQEIAAAEQEQAKEKELLLYMLAGVGGTAILGILIGLFLRRKRKRQEVWMDVAVDSMAAPESEDMSALEEQLNLLLPAEEPEAEGESTDELLVRALEEVERDPASVARLLERWVEGDGH